jgi:hypothetical protein
MNCRWHHLGARIDCTTRQRPPLTCHPFSARSRRSRHVIFNFPLNAWKRMILQPLLLLLVTATLTGRIRRQAAPHRYRHRRIVAAWNPGGSGTSVMPCAC